MQNNYNKTKTSLTMKTTKTRKPVTKTTLECICISNMVHLPCICRSETRPGYKASSCIICSFRGEMTSCMRHQPCMLSLQSSQFCPEDGRACIQIPPPRDFEIEGTRRVQMKASVKISAKSQTSMILQMAFILSNLMTSLNVPFTQLLMKSCSIRRSLCFTINPSCWLSSGVSSWSVEW